MVPVRMRVICSNAGVPPKWVLCIQNNQPPKRSHFTTYVLVRQGSCYACAYAGKRCESVERTTRCRRDVATKRATAAHGLQRLRLRLRLRPTCHRQSQPQLQDNRHSSSSSRQVGRKSVDACLGEGEDERTKAKTEKSEAGESKLDAVHCVHVTAVAVASRVVAVVAVVAVVVLYGSVV